jgi:hypothetical protein
VWPDNVLAVNTFIAAATQWRTGMAGPTGLDYTAIEPTLRLTRVPRSEWPHVFEDLRTMEDAALAQMRLTQKEK